LWLVVVVVAKILAAAGVRVVLEPELRLVLRREQNIQLLWVLAVLGALATLVLLEAIQPLAPLHQMVAVMEILAQVAHRKMVALADQAVELFAALLAVLETLLLHHQAKEATAVLDHQIHHLIEFQAAAVGLLKLVMLLAQVTAEMELLHRFQVAQYPTAAEAAGAMITIHHLAQD
jgi:hypothetical protein